ncbi:Ppx/GppA phosphatase family protein [Novosphingobium aerophilum]|uniref:Exopolyphosphatase n=1 Tax=Novosphingobium aerophilum TaxID=2839843 RepID=A0A7X1KDF7_9SPHN|nr:exopolyphosphatase [Novosphingobium aerophilum]MBC2653299.1 exopolyphosphatase [Novosphingobium aerophilum]
MQDHGATDVLAPARAIIDIGSNTVRLVIYGGPPRAPVVLHNEKVTARLGKAVAERGVLSDKAQQAALAALSRYRLLLDLRGVPQVDVVATAAVRDAANGRAFLAAVTDLGFAPRLLSGEEEAETSAMGVIGAFPGAQGVVADLGGGSLELVDVIDQASSHGVSMPLGTLRLPALRSEGLQAFRRHIAASLDRAGWAADPGQTLYLVGGSFRAFARYVLAKDQAALDDPHGFALAPEAAMEAARVLARRKAGSLDEVPGISSARLASLPDAAALLLALIEALQPARLIFSAWGLREGVLYASLPPGLRQQDPLLAGIGAFTRQRGVLPATAAMVADWTAPGCLPGGNTGDERLRLAATMLILAAAVVEPNLRAELAVIWAMRKRWIGVTNRERAMLAAALMAASARPELSPEWRQLASPADLRAAQAWGLGARLCRRFSGTAPRSLEGSALVRDGDTLRLEVRARFAALLNEGVERDLRALGTLLGMETACRVRE